MPHLGGEHGVWVEEGGEGRLAWLRRLLEAFWCRQRGAEKKPYQCVNIMEVSDGASGVHRRTGVTLFLIGLIVLDVLVYASPKQDLALYLCLFC